MASLDWGITPEEGRAIIARAAGCVVARDTSGGKPPHRCKLVEVTNRQGKIRISGGSGIWYSLGSIKPENGAAREIVEAMRAAKNTTETTARKEVQMPPEFAPRPQLKATTVPAPSVETTGSAPGSITIAASKIETALRALEAKRRDVAAAQTEYDAAKSMLDDAKADVDAAEKEARRLAVELNKLISVGT